MIVKCWIKNFCFILRLLISQQENVSSERNIHLNTAIKQIKMCFLKSDFCCYKHFIRPGAAQCVELHSREDGRPPLPRPIRAQYSPAPEGRRAKPRRNNNSHIFAFNCSEHFLLFIPCQIIFISARGGTVFSMQKLTF